MNIREIWPDLASPTETAAPKRSSGFHIPGYLILPFGRAVKRDIEKIELCAVSADGVYLSTDVPTIFIRMDERKSLCIADFDKHFGEFPSELWDDDAAVLDFMCTTTKAHNPDMTRYEALFLDLYFGTLKALLLGSRGAEREYENICDRVGVDWMRIRRHKTPNDVWRALLPIPEMQMYVRDPLATTDSKHPNVNFRVDYGFWDGSQLIAVEIDGAEPNGYSRDIRRDRLLRNAGIDVIHILNSELYEHRGRTLQKLLPAKFFGHDWHFQGKAPVIMPF